MQKDDVLYGIDNQEILSDNIDDLIEETLDNMETFDVVFTAKVYRRMKASISAELILEHALEYLDEEYSMCADDATKPTLLMKSAAEFLAFVLNQEYIPYDCELTGETIVINGIDWVKENRPEWIKETQGDTK